MHKLIYKLMYKPLLLNECKRGFRQFEYFKSKLQPGGLLFLQEMDSTIGCAKSGRMNLEVVCTFFMVHLILAEF